MVSVLGQRPFFRQFPTDIIEALCGSLVYCRMSAGRVICQQGSIGLLFYVVLRVGACSHCLPQGYTLQKALLALRLVLYCPCLSCRLSCSLRW